MLRNQSSWQGQSDGFVVVVVTCTRAKREKEKGEINFRKKAKKGFCEKLKALLSSFFSSSQLCANIKLLGLDPIWGQLP
jgi:hypothetical protein